MSESQADSAVTLTVRLTPAERKACRAAANLAGLPLTDWVRRTLFQAAGLPLQSAHRKSGWPKGRLRDGVRGPGVRSEASLEVDGANGDSAPPDAA